MALTDVKIKAGPTVGFAEEYLVGPAYGVLLTCAARLNLLEEVVALVVYEDKGGEVFYFNLPDSFHSEFGIFYALDALDVVLCQDGSRSADGAEVESAVSLAGVGHLL